MSNPFGLPQLLGLSLNVYCQYLIYRYLIVYYVHNGIKDEFERNKTGFTVAIIVFSLVVYSLIVASDPIIVIAFLIGLIYFAYTLHTKWKTNEVLPDPFSTIDKKDELSDLD